MDPVTALATASGGGIMSALGIWALWSWRKDQIHQREQNELRQAQEWERAKEERDRLAQACERLDKERRKLEEELRSRLFAMIEKTTSVIETSTQAINRQAALIEICENKAGAVIHGPGTAGI